MSLDHALPLILGVFKALGIDPVELTATVLVSFFIGFVARPLKRQIDILQVQARSSSNPVISQSAPAVLQNLSSQLSELSEDNPNLKSVASIIANGVFAAASNKKEAKAISAKLLNELEKELSRQLIAAGKSEKQRIKELVQPEEPVVPHIQFEESVVSEQEPTDFKQKFPLSQFIARIYNKMLNKGE
jgi:hypothetical protein